jgi:hypothetical protein
MIFFTLAKFRVKNQFATRSIFRNRNELYKLSQNNGKKINECNIKIKNSAISCKFAGLLDSILRDKFISRMLNEPILDMLCEEEHTKTIDEILDIALKKEASMKQIVVVEDVNKFEKFEGDQWTSSA